MQIACTSETVVVVGTLTVKVPVRTRPWERLPGRGGGAGRDVARSSCVRRCSLLLTVRSVYGLGSDGLMRCRLSTNGPSNADVSQACCARNAGELGKALRLGLEAALPKGEGAGCSESDEAPQSCASPS